MKMLKRIKLVLAAAAMVAMGGPFASAEVNIRIGGTGNPGSPDTKVIDLIKGELEKSLGQNVKVDLYPASQLGTWSEMIEQVKGGVLECLYESVGDLGDYTQAANIEGVAYLYRDEDHFFRIWRGPVGKEILDEVAEKAEIRVLGPAFRGFRQFLLKNPVDSLADLQGRKVRVPGIPAYVTSIQALGVNPTSIAFEEAYAALQQGVVDGLEQSLVAIRDHRFYEVAKHLVITNHMAETMGLMCSDTWYTGLDEKTQTAFSKAADAGADWYRQYTAENTEKIIAELKAQGVTVHLPKLDEFAQRAETAAFNPELQVIISKIRAVK
jgi:tripartite ATP-independent transporter DctP family solute receptor